MPRRYRLSRLTDRGVWISDDRICAFVTARGIAEVCYHGTLPPSRNARVLEDRRGALAVDSPSGGRALFFAAEWTPSSVRLIGKGCEVEFSAESRTLVLRCTGDARPAWRFSRAAVPLDVHGRREVSRIVRAGNGVTLWIRDRIALDDWLRRSGPYGFDFLIPESLRSRLFRRPIRSGLATAEDLRPRHREARTTLYDAEVSLRIATHGYRVERSDESVRFLPRGDAARERSIVLTFSDTGAAVRRTSPAISAKRQRAQDDSAPLRFAIPGRPLLEALANDVPALVNACVVADRGMLRASAGAYYGLWTWDATVGALEALADGRVALASGVARFVNAHRNAGGNIPMRWTGVLEPLDDPGPGGLEALLALLVDAALRAGAPASLLRATLPRFVRHLQRVHAASDARGLFPSLGFYPDLPVRFGRTARTAVSMEVGLHYVFCRTMERLAGAADDRPVADRARADARRIRRHFLAAFLRDDALADTVDLDTAAAGGSRPLFALMFLASPFGWELVGQAAGALARCVALRHLDAHGMRVLAADDPFAQTETIGRSWYPHWDLYAVRLLGRAGRRNDVARWLALAERAYEHLGFVPEFLDLRAFRDGKGDPFRAHGAAHQLSGFTAWRRALLEAGCGVEPLDDGLALHDPVLDADGLRVDGLHHLGTTWNIRFVSGTGPRRTEIDGSALRNPRIVPRRLFDGGRHEIVVRLPSGAGA